MSSATVSDAASATFAQLSAERTRELVDRLTNMPTENWFHGGMFGNELPRSHRATALQRNLDEWPVFGLVVAAFIALDVWQLMAGFEQRAVHGLHATLWTLASCAAVALVAYGAHTLRARLLDGAFASVEGNRSYSLLMYFRSAKHSLALSAEAGVPAATSALAAVESFTLDFEQLLEQASRADKAGADASYYAADYRAQVLPLRDELLAFAAASVADVETAARLAFNARPDHLVPVRDLVSGGPFTLTFDEQARARITSAREQLAAMFASS